MTLPTWQVNEKTFTNKLGAIVESSNGKNPIHFDFYDRTFLDYDWAHDDLETFDSILTRRCKQLREKYNYIRLFYSGGHDSHTMLLSFLKSNTHIDEIVINIYSYWQKKQSDVTDEYTKNHPLNREQFRAAIPFVKKITGNIPRTKITIEQMSGHYLNSDDNFMSSIQQNCMDITVDKMLHRKMLFNHSNIPNSVNLLGAEKPHLKKIDGRYFWYMVDNDIVGQATHDTSTEMFYITPDMPELHRKQCHIMMHWIKSNYPKADNTDFLNGIQDDQIRQSLNDYIRWPLWHNESNIGLGKKVISKQDPLAGIAADEKTLQTLKITKIKNLMEDARNKIGHLSTDPKSNYFFTPCFSYKYYIGR